MIRFPILISKLFVLSAILGRSGVGWSRRWFWPDLKSNQIIIAIIIIKSLSSSSLNLSRHHHHHQQHNHRYHCHHQHIHGHHNHCHHNPHYLHHYHYRLSYHEHSHRYHWQHLITAAIMISFMKTIVIRQCHRLTVIWQWDGDTV